MYTIYSARLSFYNCSKHVLHFLSPPSPAKRNRVRRPSFLSQSESDFSSLSVDDYLLSEKLLQNEVDGGEVDSVKRKKKEVKGGSGIVGGEKDKTKGGVSAGGGDVGHVGGPPGSSQAHGMMFGGLAPEGWIWMDS